MYPGANGLFTLYEDDGATFAFESGKFAKIRCEWDDTSRQMTIRAEKGSQQVHEKSVVKLATAPAGRTVESSGKHTKVKL